MIHHINTQVQPISSIVVDSTTDCHYAIIKEELVKKLAPWSVVIYIRSKKTMCQIHILFVISFRLKSSGVNQDELMKLVRSYFMAHPPRV